MPNPLQPDQGISTLAEELLRRELEKNPDQFKQAAGFDLGLPPGDPGMTALGPDKALLLGSFADAASTYAFLKRGSGREDNGLIGFTRNNPEATGLAALGGTAASIGLKKLLERIGPKGKQVADILGGGLGAYQMGLGAANVGMTTGRERLGRRTTSTANVMPKLMGAVAGSKR